jgi:hypothetical protein
VRYVGQTADLQNRFRLHISTIGNGDNGGVATWKLELRTLGLKPLLRVLAQVEAPGNLVRSAACGVEEDYINLYDCMVENHGNRDMVTNPDRLAKRRDQFSAAGGRVTHFVSDLIG